MGEDSLTNQSMIANTGFLILKRVAEKYKVAVAKPNKWNLDSNYKRWGKLKILSSLSNNKIKTAGVKAGSFLKIIYSNTYFFP